MAASEQDRETRAERKDRVGGVIAGGLLAVFLTAVITWMLVATFYGAPLGGGTAAAAPAGSTSSSTDPANMYITIQINPATGWPQYSPANFSVPTGYVMFTIYNYDIPANFSGCQCNVTGTVDNTETVNGTTYSQVPWTNVAHTFDVPELGINVLNPGDAVITFEVDFTQLGTFVWLCEMPCGSNGMSGPPMGVPGYMTGTITVG